MKPIETHYLGYRFRSRLEARWACLLSTLGIEFDYEPEGFQLDDGTNYLPDFWLPKEQAWLEIKGQEPSHEERMKCHLLADGSGHPVILLWGSLSCREIELLPGSFYIEPCNHAESFYGYNKPDEDVFPLGHHIWEVDFEESVDGGEYSLSAFLRKNGYDAPKFDGSRECLIKLVEMDREYFQKTYNRDHPRWSYGFWHQNQYIECRRDGRLHIFCDAVPFLSDKMARAYVKAQSARFEHGEAP